MTDPRRLRPWTWCVLLCVVACGGATTSASDAATQNPPPAVSTLVPPPVGAAAWLSALGELRLGMRPGVPSRLTPSTPEEAARVFERAGGTLDCATPVWISGESGVLDGHCEGTLPIGGNETPVAMTFRRFKIPGEDGAPGLLTIMAQGPFLTDPEALGLWVTTTGTEIEALHGAPRRDPANARWHLADRYILLHDAGQAPCGGHCGAYLWIGGAEHPGLVPRGFDGSAGASKP